MSKPYFTKWIPVEGEIKMGDRIIHGNVLLKEGWNWGYHDINDEESLKHFTEMKRLFEEAYVKINAPRNVMTKVVKLFLCSRDIQVGDKYLYQSWHGFKEDISKTDFRNDSNPPCFKVIGEVSPEAVWVKEGMEFEVGELCLFEKDGYGSDLSNWPLTFSDKITTYPDGGQRCYIGFKCPKCNTFH